MSLGIPFGVAFFLGNVSDLSYELAFGVGTIIFVSLIVALWSYSFQPLDVKAE
jgi:hypothetical protein